MRIGEDQEEGEGETKGGEEAKSEIEEKTKGGRKYYVAVNDYWASKPNILSFFKDDMLLVTNFMGVQVCYFINPSFLSQN